MQTVCVRRPEPLGEGKGDYRVNNVCMLEMRAHSSDFVSPIQLLFSNTPSIWVSFRTFCVIFFDVVGEGGEGELLSGHCTSLQG